MESGFYPYCGPARRDGPSRPYPKWYYPSVDSTAIIVHSVEEYLEAIDGCYRRLFNGSANVAKPELWFKWQTSATNTLLPAVASGADKTQDENALIMEFTSNTRPNHVKSYSELLFLMQRQGIPTRLMEWSADAFSALINATYLTASNVAQSASTAVWCLNPFGLNSTLDFGKNDANKDIPNISSQNADALFGSGISRKTAEAQTSTSSQVSADNQASADKQTSPDNLAAANGKTSNGNRTFTGSQPFAVYGPISDGRKSLYTVFPLRKNLTALEKLPDSASFLSQIVIPSAMRALIAQQLRRYGIL